MKARIEKRAAQLRDKMRRLRVRCLAERIKRLNSWNWRHRKPSKKTSSKARELDNQRHRMRRFLRNKWRREAAKAFLIELLDRNKYVR
jgi:exonuclease VII large subunit